MSEQAAVDRDAIVIPEYEAQIEAAKSRGANDEEMQSLSEDYQKARQEQYDRENANDSATQSRDDNSTSDSENKLTGQALDDRAAELDIQGRSDMTADEKRAAIADAENNNDNDNGDPNAAPPNITGI